MTFIGQNPADRLHDLIGHPETASRTEAIFRAIDQDPVLARLPRIEPDRSVREEEVLRVHSVRMWVNLENQAGERQALLDPDTYMVGGSYGAALGTARLGIQAVDRAIAKRENGFVIARPPGHHATHDRSMGFCLLNNVAIAAHHAIEAGAKRVVVFDHDVHHGNGTQDIFWKRADVLYQSFHLFPHYPGTGAASEIGEGPGKGYTVNAPLSYGEGEPEVRSVLETVFLPITKQFKPDVVLFSSGFDSLVGDPLGGLSLTPPFFGEMVHAYRAFGVPIVCFLEGGYQLDKIPLAATALLHALHATKTERPSGPKRAPTTQAELVKHLRAHWKL